MCCKQICMLRAMLQLKAKVHHYKCSKPAVLQAFNSSLRLRGTKQEVICGR